MEYRVLARKWRPQQFDDVVGQGHVTTTLKNAISRKRVAHAYIFTGPRGIGKTSTARILAKALNCAKGPTVSPCDSCASCQGVIEGNSMDVIEIDGASNRGIDEIRQLRENVKFAPAVGKYKIYIIDEVHQITHEAFNALLKTLEEPPGHVKFFFATTEPHKVPATILSRCQRFDLRAISPCEIVERLKQIAKSEKIRIDDAACSAIARYAQGSMRDAESILDQLVSFSEGAIGEDDVVSALGLVRESVLRQMTDALIDGECRKGLELIDTIAREGKDLPLFLADWINYLRGIMLVLTLGEECDAAGVSEESRQAAVEQSRRLSLEQMLYVMEVLTRADGQMKWTLSPRILTEMAFLKAARLKDVSSVGEIIEKIRALERTLCGGGGPAGGEAPTEARPVGLEPGPPAQDRRARVRSADDPGEQAKVRAKDLAPRHEAGGDSAGTVASVSTRSAAENGEDEGIVERVRGMWHDVVERIAVVRPLLRAYLIEGEPAGFHGGLLTLAFPEGSSHHRDYLDQPKNKQLVRKVLFELLGRDIGVRFEVARKAESRPKPQAARKEIENLKKNPLIQSALEMFQANVVEVKKK